MLSCLSLLLTTIMPWDDVSEQRSTAEAFLKSVNEKAKISSTQTDHVLLVGSVEAKQLEPMVKAVEKSVVSVMKIVGYDEKEPEDPQAASMRIRKPQWKGKLVGYICKERSEFEALFKRLRNSRPGPNEGSLFGHENDLTYFLIGPWAKNTPGKRWTWELEAVAKSASATLTRRHGAVPEWFAEGLGRYACYRHDPKFFAAEKSAAKLLAQRMSIWEAWSEVADHTDEQRIMAGTLAEAMIHSDNLKPFLSKMLANMGRSQNFEAAMNEVKLTREKLNGNWRDWVNFGK